MKTCIALLLALLLCLGTITALAGPAFPGMIETPGAAVAPVSDDAVIRQALSALRSAWQQEYLGQHYCAGEHRLDIRGTRVIRVKSELAEREAKYFGDVACMVEFLIYNDYFAAEQPGPGVGYDDAVQRLNTVVVYRSGLMQAVALSPIESYRSRTYSNDYTGFIEEVVDYGGQYNQVFTFVKP